MPVPAVANKAAYLINHATKAESLHVSEETRIKTIKNKHVGFIDSFTVCMMAVSQRFYIDSKTQPEHWWRAAKSVTQPRVRAESKHWSRSEPLCRAALSVGPPRADGAASYEQEPLVLE